jgi:hypothetical protein
LLADRPRKRRGLTSSDEQLGRRGPSRLLLEIHVGERLAVRVADNEAGGWFLDGPRLPK